MLTRGDVWLATFDPTVGSEIRKTRPCLIVSPDELNRKLSTVVVAPLTSKSRPMPFHLDIRFRGIEGFVVIEQVRTLDRKRFIKRLGEVSERELQAALSLLRALFAD